MCLHLIEMITIFVSHMQCISISKPRTQVLHLHWNALFICGNHMLSCVFSCIIPLGCQGYMRQHVVCRVFGSAAQSMGRGGCRVGLLQHLLYGCRWRIRTASCMRVRWLGAGWTNSKCEKCTTMYEIWATDVANKVSKFLAQCRTLK